jgi:hypothetical protein
MMPRFWLPICSLTGWVFLCAFQSAGEDVSSAHQASREPEPVIQYEHSPQLPAPAEERIYRYHVLTASAVAEARDSVEDSPAWAAKMVEDAEQFAALIRDLLVEPFQKEVTTCIGMLRGIRSDMQRHRAPTVRQSRELRQRLDAAQRQWGTACRPEQLVTGLLP